MARFVSGPSVTSVTSPGRRRASSRIRSTAWRSESGAVGGGSSAWPRPCGPCVSGVVSSARTSGISRPSATSISVRPASSRMARVLIADLPRIDVARDAGRGDHVGVRRCGGIQEGEAVVDPGVDVEDERASFGHAPMLASVSMIRSTTSSGVRSSTSMRWAPIPARSGSRRAACSARNSRDRGRRTGDAVRRRSDRPGPSGLRVEPEDRDTRSRHRGARVGVLDHAGRRADDVRFGRRQRVEELR